MKQARQVQGSVVWEKLPGIVLGLKTERWSVQTLGVLAEQLQN
jgi:hypothetical protein